MVISAGCAALAQPAADLREAARLDAAGRCAEAAAVYSKVLAREPDSVAALNNAGNHFLLCGQPEQARVHLERLLRLQPAHSNANLQLGRLAVRNGRKADALGFLARVKFSTDHPQSAALAGLAYAELGEHALASAAFEEWVKANPGDPDALLQLGRSSARAGNFRRAIEVLEAALRIRPQDTASLTELGLANAAAGASPRAVYLLAQAQAKAPKNAAIALALARAAEDAGYYGDAGLAYDRYLALDPANARVRRDCARVLGLTQTRREEGIAELEAYVAQFPADAVGHFYLAQLCWSNDPDRALVLLATAVKLDPQLAPAHIARAWLLHRLGRDTEAVPHLDAALRVTPDEPRALDLLGLVELALDRPESAERALRRAAELAPQDAGIALHLGRTLMNLGRETEARRWLEKYQQLRPQRQRDPRREAGMIESATLPAADRRLREVERYRAMAKARPDDPLLTLNLAKLLLVDGRVEEAVTEFRELANQNADDTIWEQAGNALVNAEQFALARTFLERAIETRPGARLDLAIAILETAGPEQALRVIDPIPDGAEAGDFLLCKARVLDRAGRSDEARQLLTSGLARVPSRPTVVRQAALLLVRDRRDREAVGLLERAVRTSPDDSELLLLRAAVVALDGQPSRAEELLRQIQSRWPEWDRPYLAHGLLLVSRNRVKEAAYRAQTAAALRSEDPAVGCLLAADRSKCESCATDLRDWLVTPCAKPQ